MLKANVNVILNQKNFKLDVDKIIIYVKLNYDCSKKILIYLFNVINEL